MPRHDAALTTRGQSFLASGVVLLGAGAALGLGDLLRIGTVLVILAVGAWALSRRPASWLHVEREVEPGRLAVDELGTVTLTLRNAGRRRSPLVLAQEHVSYPLGDRPRFVVPSLRPGAHQVVHYPIGSVVRGEHVLGPLSVRVRDGFGLTSRLTRLTGSRTVLVVPQVLPLDASALPGSGPGQDDDVADSVALHGEDDVTIRQYRQGDELRRIHWPASAHTGSLMVRQEEQPSRRRAAVLLDRRVTAHAGDGPHSSFEWAVTTAASVVGHLQDHGYDVDLVTDPVSGHERPATLDEALTTLARVVPVEQDGLAGAADVLARGTAGLVVAVVGPGSRADLEALATSHRTGTTSLAVVVDSPTFGRAADGRSAEAPPEGLPPASRPDDATHAGPRPGRLSAAASVELLRRYGWRAVVAGHGTTPAQAWREIASTRRSVR
ncbi:DUF58 domain-containing protein [uncultured Arsenicicoccus sp.]|uniref:DUF58 domain-containing protein n=1 Tax=uncultured Arsenicicoccus sp. TaxID=491339 RepID=UPI0025960700|nr:DUF58 domain-containing protein [uncultured Arsenicicoccus sp.]